MVRAMDDIRNDIRFLVEHTMVQTAQLEGMIPLRVEVAPDIWRGLIDAWTADGVTWSEALAHTIDVEMSNPKTGQQGRVPVVENPRLAAGTFYAITPTERNDD